MNDTNARLVACTELPKCRIFDSLPLPPLPDWAGPGAKTAPDRPAHEKKAAINDGDLPEIEDTVDFLARDMEKPKTLIAGVLHQGSKMILGSGSKSFKTWTLLDLGMSVAAGVPWLGLDTTKGKVLFLNFELKPVSIRSRIEAIKTARDLTWEKGCFDIWNLRGYAASFDIIIPKILERVKASKYDLVILDPVYKLYGDVDENSAGDVAGLMNELERLATKSGAAVVFSAHFSKGNQAGKESKDRVSGSGVFGREPDSILTLTRHEQEDCFVLESDLRDFEQLEPFVVKWEFPVMVRNECLNPQKLKTAISRKCVYTVDDLVKAIVTEPITTKQLKKTVLETTGMSQSRFYELLPKLANAEGVEFDEATKTWSHHPVQSNARLT